MHPVAITAILAALLTLPAAARAAPPRAEGHIDSEEGRIEVLGTPVRVGERIELPEGYLIVEEQGTEDRNVGSFGIVPAGALATAAPQPSGEDAAATATGPGAAPPAVAPPATASSRPCRSERTAYLRELWRQSGIEVSDPERVMEGLEGDGQGAKLGFFWHALATDPFRPMAWSSELRSRAEALVRCVKGSAAASSGP